MTEDEMQAFARQTADRMMIRLLLGMAARLAQPNSPSASADEILGLARAQLVGAPIRLGLTEDERNRLRALIEANLADIRAGLAF